MTTDEVLAAFGDLTVWKRGDRWAPHKPLLILLALGEWECGNHNPLAFATVKPRLRNLLRTFGPPRADGPDDPFWRLKGDGVWEVGQTKPLTDLTATDPPNAETMERVTGQFAADVRAALDRSPELVGWIARRLLDARFPDSLHSDILAAVGLDSTLIGTPPPSIESVPLRRRDPKFRDAVMSAYEGRCAMCGVGIRFKRTSTIVGVEAAHIMWFQAEGPDIVTNGLALCSLHHKAFDLGAFTVEPDGRIVVSRDLEGAGIEDVLEKYRDGSVRQPTVGEDRPASKYLEWHREEVFRGRERE
jgi:putative restriction endonuclease